MGVLSGVVGLGDDVPNLRVSFGTPTSGGIAVFSSFCKNIELIRKKRWKKYVQHKTITTVFLFKSFSLRFSRFSFFSLIFSNFSNFSNFSFFSPFSFFSFNFSPFSLCFSFLSFFFLILSFFSFLCSFDF